MRQETGPMNKSRINCFLYMDARLTATELPRQVRTPAYVQQRLLHLSVEMNQCKLLHSDQQCALDWAAWMNDHPANGIDMAAVYANQTESEAEAEERLSGDSGSEDWDSAEPASSFT